MNRWGRGRRYWRIDATKLPKCEWRMYGVACGNEATHGCINAPPMCDIHRNKCCKPIRLIGHTPLQKLGSWMFGQSFHERTFKEGNSILNAPQDLLLAAFVHVEARLMRLGPPNARTRATEKWLGKWATMISKELARQGALT